MTRHPGGPGGCGRRPGHAARVPSVLPSGGLGLGLAGKQVGGHGEGGAVAKPSVTSYPWVEGCFGVGKRCLRSWPA